MYTLSICCEQKQKPSHFQRPLLPEYLDDEVYILSDEHVQICFKMYVTEKGHSVLKLWGDFLEKIPSVNFQGKLEIRQCHFKGELYSLLCRY